MSRGIIIRAFLPFVIGGALLLFNSSTCLRAVVDTSSSGKMEYYEGWPHMMDTPIEESLFLSIVDESQWEKDPVFYDIDSEGQFYSLDIFGNPVPVFIAGRVSPQAPQLNMDLHRDRLIFRDGTVKSLYCDAVPLVYEKSYSSFRVGKNFSGEDRIIQVFYIDNNQMKAIDNLWSNKSLWLETFNRIQ